MEVLSEYIVSAFIASLIAGIGEKIAPSSMKKYVTFIASLLLLVFLLSPLKTLGNHLSQIPEDILNSEEEDSSIDNSNTILKITKEKTEESIQKHLMTKFTIQDTFSVSLDMKQEENGILLLTHIQVHLSKSDESLASEIQTYLETSFNTKTDILTSD